MPTLVWIIAAGSAMTVLALSGSLTFILPDRVFDRVVLPLVALAAGSLLGGALFHLLPESVAALGNSLSVYGWLAAGLLAFLILEQYLHWWHHCHRPVSAHRPVGYLILIADALHNLVGGLAIGAAFVTDIRLGIVTWLIAAAHEVSQEMGDFGILIHSGWTRSRPGLEPGLRLHRAARRARRIRPVRPGQHSHPHPVRRRQPHLHRPGRPGTRADHETSRPAHDKAIHTIGFTAGLALLWGIALAA